jgi:hypothetical protein
MSQTGQIRISDRPNRAERRRLKALSGLRGGPIAPVARRPMEALLLQVQVTSLRCKPTTLDDERSLGRAGSIIRD